MVVPKGERPKVQLWPFPFERPFRKAAKGRRKAPSVSSDMSSARTNIGARMCICLARGVLRGAMREDARRCGFRWRCVVGWHCAGLQLPLAVWCRCVRVLQSTFFISVMFWFFNCHFQFPWHYMTLWPPVFQHRLQDEICVCMHEPLHIGLAESISFLGMDPSLNRPAVLTGGC